MKKAFYSQTVSQGYDRWMSANANRSYDRGEMPLSKWMKELGIKDYNVLMTVLQSTGWHHTGRYGMKTNFYELVSLLSEKAKSYLKSEVPASKKKFWSVVNFLFV